MSALRVQPRTTRIIDLEAHLRWRRRTEGKLMIAMCVAFVLGLVCGLPTVVSWPFFGKDLLSWLAIFLAVIAFVLCGIAVHISPLSIQDVSALLKSDDVTSVPVLAEYHEYFSIRPGLEGLEKMRILRTHIVELLRSKNEVPKLEFSGSRLVSLIRMIAYVEDQEDRLLLLKVIAKVGTPSNVGEIDLVVRKVCTWELRHDRPAKHTLMLKAAECMAAMRTGNHTLEESQSLLRPADASNNLLTPSSAPRPNGDVDNLLHAVIKLEE